MSKMAEKDLELKENIRKIAKILKKIIITLLIALTFITCLSNYYFELKQKELANYINMLERNIYARDKQNL